MSEILDQDMQMVRDFLKQWGAPFHVTEHFENLVSEYWKEAARVEELASIVDDLTEKVADRDELEQEHDRLQEELNDRDARTESALIAVKYWLHDAIYLRRPMRIAPRDILRQVEDAL